MSRTRPRTLSLLLALTLAGAAGSPAATVRIGIPERNNLQFIALWVALGAGYFRDRGVDAQPVYASAPDQAGRLLFQNEADIALLQPPLYLALMAQGRPIVLFANLLANDPINLVVRPQVASGLKADPGAPLVDRLKALKGLRIGVGNEPPRRLRVLFALAGMDADRDIRMTILPGEAQIAAYASGAVDALFTHTPFLEEALVGGGVLWVNPSAGEAAPLSGGQIHSLATTREYARAHPEIILAVTRAIASAETLLHRDAAASVRALLAAGIREPSAKHLETIVRLYGQAVPATPAVSASAVERDAALYPTRGPKPDFTKVHAADFLAPEFAEQAAKDAPPEALPPVRR